MVRGRGVNGREHADVLQSVQMAGTRGFSSRPHTPTCVWKLQGGVNNVTMALDALGIHLSEEGGEKERGTADQGGKWGCFTPQSLSNGQGKVTGGRRGSGAAVVQS